MEYEEVAALNSGNTERGNKQKMAAETSSHWWQNIPRRFSLTRALSSPDDSEAGESDDMSPSPPAAWTALKSSGKRRASEPAACYKQAAKKDLLKKLNIPEKSYIPPWLELEIDSSVERPVAARKEWMHRNSISTDAYIPPWLEMEYYSTEKELAEQEPLNRRRPSLHDGIGKN